MLAIEILGLEKTYQIGFWRKKDKRALLPLHLTVEKGETFGFLGQNGAGKTTTLKLLMGLIYPTAGTARILGHDWRETSFKSRIGFLPEHPYFYDYLTARELLRYYASLSGMDSRDRDKRVEEMLNLVGLTHVEGLALRKFSKGMLQRLGIAQAILHKPELVFLDEPMSGLDPIGRREVRDLIQQLKEEGTTVFFSTHILTDAEALCDRVGVIHKGELRGVGNVADLTAGTHSEFEVVFAGAAATKVVQAMGFPCKTAGELIRANIPTQFLERSMDAIKNNHGRLISVNPVLGSLEEYFMAKIQNDATMEVQH